MESLGGCTEHSFSWWWKKMLIFLPSSCIFHLPSKLGHNKTLSEGQPTPGHKGQKHRGLLIRREVHHLCVFSLMHVGSRSRLQHTICHVAEAIQMFLRDFGSTDAIISSCQNLSTTKPHAAASACPRSGASKSNLSNAILSKPVGSVGGEKKKKACNAVANLGTKSAQDPREVRFLRYLHSKPLSQKRRQSGWYKQNLNKDSEFEAFLLAVLETQHFQRPWKKRTLYQRRFIA